MENSKYTNREELEARLGMIKKSPKDRGEIKLIVRRPDIDEREILHQAILNPQEGLVGDNWKSRSPNGGPRPERQLTIMNSRVISLLANEKDDWVLAGDQLYIDMDLSVTNLPPGTQLNVGTAIIEITALPHTGCRKFSERFGVNALEFVNSPTNKEFRLRGVNAKVIQAGEVRYGDIVTKINKGRA